MGLFGKKGKVQLDLGGAFAGFMAGMGAPGGAQTLQAHHQRKQSLLDGQREEEQYQRRLQDQYGMWQKKEEWERQNPAPAAPTEFQRSLIEAGHQPGSPEYVKMMRQYVANKANPFTQMRVQNPDGSESLQFVRPPMGGGADLPQTLSDDDWGAPQPNGGQSVAPAGGFPRFTPIQRSNGSTYNRW